MKFSLDPKGARSVGKAQMIDISGAYEGVFKDAYFIRTRSGAGFMHFDFLSVEGQRCNISMCVQKINGEATFNRAIVDAIMTVLRLKEVVSVSGDVNRNGTVTPVDRFPELIDKPIGLLLQRINDPSNERYPYSMNIVTPFDKTTKMTAAEILDRATEAKAMEKRLATLKDRTLRVRTSEPIQEASSSEPDENIPF